jgi:chromate reductase, NAD(P)H dehydrogenase (quinone)
MKILFFGGSLRKASLNQKYVKLAYEHFKKKPEVDAELVHLIDFLLPVYNQDIDDKEFPKEALALAQKVKAADAVIISTPENNGAIAAVTKNTVDWLSREKAGNPWPGKHIFLMGASPGFQGAIRGLVHTRVPFEKLGCFVYPEMSALPKAHEAFNEDGSLKDKASLERLAKLLDAFYEHIKR